MMITRKKKLERTDEEQEREIKKLELELKSKTEENNKCEKHLFLMNALVVFVLSSVFLFLL